MKRSSRRMAGRSGSPCAARTTSPCSTRKTFTEKTRIITPSGPGMQIFSPDGKYGYICSSFNPETDVVSVADHKIVAKVKQDSPFCPNIAATPGRQPGLVHAQGHRQDAGVRCKAAVQPDQDHRHRPDHQPRQFRPHREGHVCLCHDRRVERGQGVPHRRFLAGRDHPGRQSSARRVAVGRRHAGSMSGSRMPMRLRRSTPRPTR